MAYFAELNPNSVVLRIIIINDEDMLDEHGHPQEYLGIARCRELTDVNTEWRQTKYENGFRFRPAQVGYVYSADYDVFMEQQPFPSWSLDTVNFEWVPPVPAPVLTQEQRMEGYYVSWNEQERNWDILRHLSPDQ